MDATDIDFENLLPIDHNRKAIDEQSKATPMSTLIWAIAEGDMATVEAQITDGVEWGLMPYNKVLRGKAEVMPWFEAAVSDRKRPLVISNAATSEWGVFEYWNIGVLSREVIQFGNSQKWPWPTDPELILGRPYRVAQCFVYHIVGDGRIDLMRQYLDTGSVWAQFTK